MTFISNQGLITRPKRIASYISNVEAEVTFPNSIKADERFIFKPRNASVKRGI